MSSATTLRAEISDVSHTPVLKYGLPPHRTDTHSPFNRGRRGVFYLLEDSQKDLYIARHRRKTDVLQLQEGDVIPGVIIHRSDLLRFALPREWNLHRYRRTAFANACRRATSRSFFQCSFPSISSTAEVLYVHEVSTPAGKQRVLVCKELDGTEAAVACNENLLRILQSPKYSQQPRILVQFKNTIHETVQLDLRGRGIFAVQRPLRLFKPYGVRPALRVPLRVRHIGVSATMSHVRCFLTDQSRSQAANVRNGLRLLQQSSLAIPFEEQSSCCIVTN